MPPEAMASRVVVTISRVSSLPLWAWARSASSTMVGCGNLGARPNPPHSGSYARPQRLVAALEQGSGKGSPPSRSAPSRPKPALRRMASASWSAWPSSSGRRSRHTSATWRSRSTKVARGK